MALFTKAIDLVAEVERLTQERNELHARAMRAELQLSAARAEAERAKQMLIGQALGGVIALATQVRRGERPGASPRRERRPAPARAALLLLRPAPLADGRLHAHRWPAILFWPRKPPPAVGRVLPFPERKARKRFESNHSA